MLSCGAHPAGLLPAIRFGQGPAGHGFRALRIDNEGAAFVGVLLSLACRHRACSEQDVTGAAIDRPVSYTHLTLPTTDVGWGWGGGAGG